MTHCHTVFRLFALLIALFPAVTHAQYTWQETDREPSKPHLTSSLTYRIETQATLSKGQTPLWLNANRYGLSSLDKTNGYVRAAVMRPLSADSARRWAIGYCADVAVPLHYTSNAVVQQA